VGSLGAAFEWLGVQRAWARTRGSPDVVVAIVDHETPGSHVAGVAAGRHDAAQFSGVAPAVRTLPVRVGAHGTQAHDLAQAIEYAVETGACIVNVAQGADLADAGVRRAIQHAATRNALVVCPADADDDAREDAPNLIRVLAVDAECRPLSNYVRRAREPAAHLAAPGFARVPQGHGAGHVEVQAPAIGAPYVSGCAALIKSLNPHWGYREIREHLLASGRAHDKLGAHCASGQLLDVARAVLGPLEHAGVTGALTWSSLTDGELRWTLRYRSARCVNTVALYRPHGDEYWRELAFARAGALRMTVPAASLRRSSGVLRLATRESNFHADDLELTIR
jgi:hypothetical protein